MSVDLGGRRVGRPRLEAADQAIADATIECLVAEGYTGMSVDRVAERAGVGRATIYRRWSSKAELVIDAVGSRTFDALTPVDTGNLRDDLEQTLTQIQSMMQREYELIQTLNLVKARHPEVGEAFRCQLDGRLEAMTALFQRGVDRGELPADADVDLLARSGPALLWHRFTVSGEVPPADYAARIVALLLGQGSSSRRASSR